MLARSAPTCSTFGLSSSSAPERARPVDLPPVYPSAPLSRNLNVFPYVRLSEYTDDSRETQRQPVCSGPRSYESAGRYRLCPPEPFSRLALQVGARALVWAATHYHSLSC